nr:MAG TPA: hypothetical protein [Caudoviricetes sp.]
MLPFAACSKSSKFLVSVAKPSDKEPESKSNKSS